MDGTLYRLSAFTTQANGGNPAGVWLGEQLPDADTMQRIAAEVGYSETAFIAPRSGTARTIRYYSPEAQVGFCGHATIAAGVVLGRTAGADRYHLSTTVGEVPVTVREQNGQLTASLVSVAPRHAPVSEALLTDVLACLGWSRRDLDPNLPPARAYAGVWHLVLAVTSEERLNRLAYDFEKLKALMLGEQLTTLQLVYREQPQLFHARNPFPVGGVVEDPATGAAAAALGGYLRDAGLLEAPTHFVIRQGEAMGRPSRLLVEVPANGGIVVSGTAVDM